MREECNPSRVNAHRTRAIRILPSPDPSCNVHLLRIRLPLNGIVCTSRSDVTYFAKISHDTVASLIYSPSPQVRHYCDALQLQVEGLFTDDFQNDLDSNSPIAIAWPALAGRDEQLMS